METILKSSQEMAAQLMDVYPYFSDGSMPEDHVTKLTKQARELKSEVKDMNPYMLPDNELTAKLAEVKTRATETGVWDPTKGEGADERSDYAVEKKIGYGYTPEEAALVAIKDLRRNGYLDAIRYNRKEQEQLFRDPVDEYIKEHVLDRIAENKEVEHLLERTIDITTLTPTELAKLSQDFPSGNFVYHGAGTEQLIKIIDSGALVNAKVLYEREKEVAKAEGRDAGIVHRNSGFEGISWSMNGIDALPGDRYHLAGFIGSPEAVLSDNQQLAVPSRPAPNEVIQISSEVEADRLYDAKTQFELYLNPGMIGELNSVLDNLLSIDMWKPEEASQFRDEPMLYQAKRGILAQPNYQEQLRQLYDTQPDGTIRLSSDLLQQVVNEIPVAAVWLQAVIDKGRLKDTVFAGQEVSEIIDNLDSDNIKELFAEMKKDSQPFEDIINESERVGGDVEIPVDNMYFVAPRKDIETWLRVFARSKHKPAGILLYDDKKVRLENFASSHKGDHTELTNELRTAINPDNSDYIKYADVLGSEFSDDMRAGHKHQVIAEQYLLNRKTVRKIKNKLVIQG